MKRVARVMDFASSSGGWVAIIAIWLIFLLTLAEVVSRTFFHKYVPGTMELSQWLLVGSVFMGAAWTLKAGGHVRIGLLSSRLTQRGQCWVTIYLAALGMIVVSFVAFYGWQTLIALYIRGSVMESVLYLPQWWGWIPFGVGLSLLAVQFANVIIENIVRVRAMHRAGGGLLPVWFIGFAVALIGTLSFCLAWPQAQAVNFWLVLLVIFGLVLGFVASSMWIFLVLTSVGILGLLAFTSYPVGLITARVYFGANMSFVVTCIPLFILMGELLLQSGVTKYLYSGLSTWVGRLPGRMLHSNILSCTLFAAVSGSSAATCATIATVAVPELERLGYDRGIALGSLAGAGTLGLLIPPSLVMIVYGAMAAESIGQLFIGGVIPGLMLSFLFMGYIGIVAIRRPSIAPMARAYSWKQRWVGLLATVPIVIVIGLVLGLIYAGITTPTEAATIGTASALCALVAYKKLNWRVVKEASWQSLRVTCMVMLIVAGAILLSTTLAYLAIPQHLVSLIVNLGLSKYMIFAIVCLMYVALGCLFEGISMMVMTLPIIYPIIIAMGFDGIWFGIVLVILIEMAQITPPVGFNLYVLQNISGENIGVIVRNSIPFFFLMVVTVIILVLFPQVALWLPSIMIGR